MFAQLASINIYGYRCDRAPHFSTLEFKNNSSGEGEGEGGAEAEAEAEADVSAVVECTV